MSATSGRSGADALDFLSTGSARTARALHRFRRHRRPAAPDAPNAEPAHDVRHPAASDSGRIPAPGDQPGTHLPVSVHGHEEIQVDLEDAARQRLAAHPHAADGTRFEHTAAARRDGPAVQRFGQCPADRPDPGTALEFVDVRDVDAVSGQAQPRKKPMPSSRPPRAPASPTGI